MDRHFVWESSQQKCNNNKFIDVYENERILKILWEQINYLTIFSCFFVLKKLNKYGFDGKVKNTCLDNTAN